MPIRSVVLRLRLSVGFAFFSYLRNSALDKLRTWNLPKRERTNNCQKTATTVRKCDEPHNFERTSCESAPVLRFEFASSSRERMLRIAIRFIAPIEDEI